MRRLTGRRIIVTRSADRAGALCDLLSAQGADVVEIPTVETAAAPDGGMALHSALASLGDYEWLVVTSPEGARRVRRALPDVDRQTVKIAAVGRATADVIGRVDLVPDVQTGAALGESFPNGTGRVLFAAALDAGTDFEAAARAKGWTVDRVTAYATQPVEIDTERARASVSTADAVIFASGSAARSWVRSLGNTMPAHVIAMGPSTARVLDELGIAPVVVAGEQSLDGLVAAVVETVSGQ